MGDILRVFVIVAGAYMFLKAILSLAKRKMTEPLQRKKILMNKKVNKRQIVDEVEVERKAVMLYTTIMEERS